VIDEVVGLGATALMSSNEVALPSSAQVRPSCKSLPRVALLFALTASSCLRTTATSRDGAESLARATTPADGASDADGPHSPLSSATSCPERTPEGARWKATYDWSNPVPFDCGEAEQSSARTSDAGADAPLDTSDAVVVVKGLLQPFKDCYHHTLSLDPCEEGSLRLRMEVDCRGAVRSLRADARTLSSQTVQCVMDVASQARFSAPNAGSAKLELPISFKRP
jgi:hypothetical protein